MAAVWLRRLVLATFIFLAFVPATAFAATMDYLGTWSSSTTYATGKVVKHNGGIFYSLKSTNSAPNRNKPPSDNPAWWEPVGSAVKPRAVYDATGKFIGVMNNGWLVINSGSQQVLVDFRRDGFSPECTGSAAECVPSAANNYLGDKVYTTSDCSGTAYYSWEQQDISRGRTYGTSSAGVVSFDWYFPTNLTLRTISSWYVGSADGCQRMNYLRFQSPSVSIPVHDGTFTKVTISGFTAPFYIK
ncbi:hypothetical protein [Aestuariivirga sp.]|jgi:hypothetical protein|uniref:hypothetical protein n=1 Tax=Aestuariivirga sp. TaxID=2650926 RepID=UPI00378505B3